MCLVKCKTTIEKINGGKNMVISKGLYRRTVKAGEKKVEAGVPEIGNPDKYELFLRRPDVLEVLLTLETDNKKMLKKELLHIAPEDLLYWGSTYGGAQIGLNRVFAASANAPEGLRLPFYARARGDEIQIGRIADEYNAANYATGGNGGADHEEPTKMQPDRVKDWLEKFGAVGIRFEPEIGEKWKPLSNEGAVKLVKKIPADILQETEKLLADEKVVYNEELTRIKAEEQAAKAEKEAETAEAEVKVSGVEVKPVVEKVADVKPAVESKEENKARIERMAATATATK